MNLMTFNIQEEKRRRLERETEFSAEDLSLATVPGLDFDPKKRSFEVDELRPQPIIKKRSKLFVKDQEKVLKLYFLRQFSLFMRITFYFYRFRK